jgi:hypothetical protein
VQYGDGGRRRQRSVVLAFSSNQASRQQARAAVSPRRNVPRDDSQRSPSRRRKKKSTDVFDVRCTRQALCLSIRVWRRMQELEEIEIQRHSESDPTKIVPSAFSPTLHAAPALQLMTPPTLTQHTARPRASSQSTHAWSRRSTPKLSSRKPASSSTAQRSALLSLRRCDSHPQPLLPHARLAGTCPSSPSVWDRKRSRPLHAQTSPFDPSCPLCETEQNKVPLNCGRSGCCL